MNKNQQAMVSILSAAIRGKCIEKIEDKNIDWENMFQEAKYHDVHALLYPLIKNLNVAQIINKNLISEWCKASILGGIYQMQHMTEMHKVFMSFNEIGIPLIALKGLVVRRLYPHPELRSMSDADILVLKEDVYRSKQLLIELGYIESNSDSIHAHFDHEKHLPIELHWSLVNESHIKTAKDFQDKIWGNAVPIDVSNEPVLTLCPEDQVLHICLHMAVHFLSSGFGLRQLCDFVLVVEFEKDSIDWKSFYHRCKLNGIYTFVVAIFTICKQLFGMEFGEMEYFSSFEDIHFVNMLIEDIFSGGVYGKRDATRVNANSILHLQDHEYCGHEKSKFLLGLSFIFPPSNKLDKRYAYAKNFFILTPIAWAHRFIYNMFKKDFNMFKKIISFSSSISITQNRSEIIHWLNL